jgi:hypothetical protein
MVEVVGKYILYSKKNINFLRNLAKRLSCMTQDQKKDLHGNKVKYGTTKYLLLYQNGDLYLVADSRRTKGAVYLAPNR